MQFGFKFRSSLAALTLALVTIVVSFPCLSSAHGSAVPEEEKLGILLVAFGSSMPEAQASFRNIEAKVHAAYPDIPVQWAFTSHIIREKLARTEGKDLLSPMQALAAMADSGFTHVAVQSLHTIPGEEFHGLLQTVNAFRFPGGIAHLSVGAPLLAVTADLERAAEAMLANVPEDRTSDEAVVFMGHGTHHPGNVYYIAMQEILRARDPLAFIGTVEGSPSLDQVRAELKKNDVHKAWLVPFMSVAGDHARNDMAGPEEDSWISILTADGVNCTPVLKGSAEFDNVVQIWVDHLDHALEELR
ncbi:sirohydrochlorin cobaltochelatase [Paucidesulfovibrio gracilis DSM 16080]|uniref:Sirohydrochlorin cobaltochelatase n=2 Tax=Paucidesulfovibrio TaxID=2910985 RepID=A0A1T4WQA4_9BACT|nr:sirohydrochlorin cobaltochelatase [Paucidesulfovibrio gracilis DSM 16080]